MLKFGFEYSFYIFYETLWFVSADKTTKVFEVHTAGSS